MSQGRVLVVGGGIAGLSAAIAMRRAGVDVTVLEAARHWSIQENTGIVLQTAVVRAMARLGLAREFISAGFAHNQVRVYDQSGKLLAEIPGRRIAGTDYPALLGISRSALHRVLGEAAEKAGVLLRFGATLERVEQGADSVSVQCSDGTESRYELLVGADGLHSRVRNLIFGGSERPQYSGQGLWCCNLPRPAEIDCLTSMASAHGTAGVCPMSDRSMYLYVTCAEPANAPLPEHGQAAMMRSRLSNFGGFIAELAAQIRQDADVVYRSLDTLLLTPPWHRGRTVLIGDAAHACTPHLGQGAGLAIEDAIVLAEEYARVRPLSEALAQFMRRRWERVRYLWETSVQIGRWELEGRRDLDRPALLRKMLEVTVEPI